MKRQIIFLLTGCFALASCQKSKEPSIPANFEKQEALASQKKAILAEFGKLESSIDLGLDAKTYKTKLLEILPKTEQLITACTDKSFCESASEICAIYKDSSKIWDSIETPGLDISNLSEATILAKKYEFPDRLKNIFKNSFHAPLKAQCDSDAEILKTAKDGVESAVSTINKMGAVSLSSDPSSEEIREALQVIQLKLENGDELTQNSARWSLKGVGNLIKLVNIKNKYTKAQKERMAIEAFWSMAESPAEVIMGIGITKTETNIDRKAISKLIMEFLWSITRDKTKVLESNFK